MFSKKKIFYADDDFESIGTLVRLRLPSLGIGLFLGLFLSFATSSFEQVLQQNVQMAFFIPFVVYIAAAVGGQTGAIYARDLRSKKAKFSNYFRKELILGLIFGLLFSLSAGAVIFLWLQNPLVALSVTLSTFFAVALAPLVALFITEIIQLLGKDPAAGSGPITNVIQDIISIVIYGIISSVILL